MNDPSPQQTLSGEDMTSWEHLHNVVDQLLRYERGEGRANISEGYLAPNPQL